MRAVVLLSAGGAERLKLTEMARPAPQPGAVLVRLAATSVNQVDIRIREGLSIGPDLPAVLGCDVAGVVEAVGDGVLGFMAGDAVWGCAGGVKGNGGTLAEYIAADARLLAVKPRTLSMREAAALPLVAITAWEALERVRLQPHDHVLVHAGIGGVGHVAVQLAKARGARVSATVNNPSDGELARTFGADATILYKEEPVASYVERLTAGRGFDAIIDTVGGKNLVNSFCAAALNGRVATTSSRIECDLSPMHSKGLSLHVVFMLIPMLHDLHRERHGRIMGELSLLADGGKLRPLIDTNRFELAQTADAQRYLESGAARGKVVIDIL